MAYFTQIYYKNFAGLNYFVIVGPFWRKKGECFVILSLISSHFRILLYFRAKSHSNVTSLQRDYEAWEKYLKIGWFRLSISINSAHKANLSTHSIVIDILRLWLKRTKVRKYNVVCTGVRNFVHLIYIFGRITTSAFTCSELPPPYKPREDH